MWRAFVEAREAGLAREIGVSNFDAVAPRRGHRGDRRGAGGQPDRVEPAALRRRDAVAEHRARGIALEGYSALRGGTLEHPAIVEIAERLGRTPAQVIIRWHLQHEIVVIPKSVNADRIRSNADVAGFSLTDEDMATLDALGSR